MRYTIVVADRHTRVFRRMARGTKAKDAYSAAVSFYRSSGHRWTQQLSK